MEFFATVEQIIAETVVTQKLGLLANLQQQLSTGAVLRFDHASVIRPVGNPSYVEVCRIVHGSAVERRRNLGTAEGRAVFLHAIAHIEYSAIDLALDSAYRFRNLPPQYYDDWLTVAFDEARHFAMLQTLIRKLGFDYGSFSVHTGIFDAMARSAISLRRRMAATHRHLEAGGLDAHPELMRKIAQFDDAFAGEICSALAIIFNDEISHVRAGDFWFRYACARDQVTTAVFADDILSSIPGAKLTKKNINRDARKRAGFTDAELDALNAM